MLRSILIYFRFYHFLSRPGLFLVFFFFVLSSLSDCLLGPRKESNLTGLDLSLNGQLMIRTEGSVTLNRINRMEWRRS